MNKSFSHPSQKAQKDKPLVYTAMSKHVFYARMLVSVFVLEHGGVPLNPFMIFDYFLAGAVSDDLVREGNNNLVKRCDEIWIFGPISDGVLAEIQLAKEQNKPIRYFAIRNRYQITEITKAETELEPEISHHRALL